MSYNEWLDIEILEDYLEGKLDAKAMHKVERASLDDPFVAEALAGLTAAKKRKQSLSILQKQLQDRIAVKPIEQKRWRLTSQRLSIAAAAAVLFLTVSIFFFMRENSRTQLANKSPKQVDVTVAPQIATTQNKTDQAIDKSGNTKPDSNTSAIIAQALAAAKTTAVAVNKKPKPPIEPSVSPVGRNVELNEVRADKNIVAQQNILKEEVIALNEKAAVAKQASPSSVVLQSKVAGISVPQKVVTGRVIDKVSNLPLSSVSIMMLGSQAKATTDVNGVFKIPVDKESDDITLNFAYLGFKSKEVKVNAKDQNNIQLEHDNNSLSEVVVTGYGTNTKKASASQVFTTSAPAMGWNAYNEYIDANIKNDLPKTAAKVDVELSFGISSNGKPINIKVLKSGGKEFDKEAIRLLKSGGKWTYSSNGTNIANLNISFNK